jgi:sulfate permease, SulP family
MKRRSRLSPPEPSFREVFTPKLMTVLGEGYGLTKLRTDAAAGLTVAIVALPLSMAIAIASGVSPDRGLYAAIIGGFIVSLLGGSRYQIGGPAGAFIVLVAAIVDRQGVDGFLLATLIAGAILALVGFLRLGTYIKYIPHPVTIGFTAGIAVIILASQMRDLFGLRPDVPEPGPIIDKIQVLGGAALSFTPAAVAVGLGSIALILLLKHLRPTAPGMLIAVVAAALITALLNMPVETIGTRFGGIPKSLPMPALPTITLSRVIDVLPDAFAIALLAGIESLLSAVVADSMSGRRHRSNCELVAQGFANMASALFGGIAVTGTIARTATNIRSGAVGPVSGMLHAVFLLGFMMLAAPLASYIPLAALAGVLTVVAWNMAERHEFLAILRRSRGEAVVLLATFLLTVFYDLMTGILVGVVLGSLLFMHRMATLVAIEHGAVEEEDRNGDSEAQDVSSHDVMVYHITGPIFFGAAATIASTFERIGGFPPVIILDFESVPFADSSALGSLETFVIRAKRKGSLVYFSSADREVRRILSHGGLKPPLVRYAPSVAHARASAAALTG